MELVTEVICFLLAKEMGLPVPPICIVHVKPQIAARLGVLGDVRSGSKVRTSESSNFRCLGVRQIEEVEVDNRGKPRLPVSPGAARHLAGGVTFHVLTLNAISGGRVFRGSNGRAQPIFTDFRHCLMNSDWPRFQKATYRQQVACSLFARGVKSYKQLEVWVQRAEQVDMGRICETVVKLPGDWYHGNPMPVVNGS